MRGLCSTVECTELAFSRSFLPRHLLGGRTHTTAAAAAVVVCVAAAVVEAAGFTVLQHRQVMYTKMVAGDSI